jgi:hypothetical protein
MKQHNDFESRTSRLVMRHLPAQQGLAGSQLAELLQQL